MKKCLALILGAVFVLGFAASAFAIHAEIPEGSTAMIAKGGTTVTLGGYLQMRGWARNNTFDLNDDTPDHQAWLETRVVLSLNAKVTPNTQIQITLRDTKNSNGDDDMTWGAVTGGDSRGIFREGANALGVAQSSLEFIEAYILHTGSGLLGVPSGLKVGHMPLALGNKLFFDHTKNGDDAILVFADPLKELEIAALTIKFREGSLQFDDDSNAYVGLFNYRTKEFGISGDVTYVDDQTGATVGGTNANKKPIHLWNFGLRGDVNLGGLKLMADGEIQTGKSDKGALDGSGRDLDFSGWAVLAGLGYNMSGVDLGIDYAYGSGVASDDGPTKFKGFVTALDNNTHYSFIYEYMVPASSGSAQTGIFNTQYVKIYAGTNLMAGLRGDLAIFGLWANETAQGQSSDLGWEVDPKISWQIDKNLKYWVEGGYFISGDFYKVGTKSPDDAWAIRHGIRVDF